MNQPDAPNVPIQAADLEPLTSNSPSEESSDWRFQGVAPMIRKAMEKHYREWEGLMKRHANRWVIYHGDERLEIGTSRADLYRKYVGRGFKREDLLVLGVCPPIEDEHER
jgi:hypothetical protein